MITVYVENQATYVEQTENGGIVQPFYRTFLVQSHDVNEPALNT